MFRYFMFVSVHSNIQLSDLYLLGIFLFLLVLFSVVQFVIRDHTVVLVPPLEKKWEPPVIFTHQIMVMG